MDKKSTHFLFYSEDISTETLVLQNDEVAHMTNVLRFKEGDQLSVTDGKGTIYLCRLEKLKKSTALCSIHSSRFEELPKPKIVCYIGLPDKERLERACELLPPLNVSRIVPVINEHCRKPWWTTRWYKSAERCNRIIVSSQKQSFNPYLTTFDEPTDFSKALEEAEGTILYGDETGSSFQSIQTTLATDTLSIFVGPPGGFSEEEKEIFAQKGAQKLSLGLFRLRTELAITAAASLCTQLFTTSSQQETQE